MCVLWTWCKLWPAHYYDGDMLIVKVKNGWLIQWSWCRQPNSPSIVEQLQQGWSSDFYTFISDCSQIYDMSCALCLSASFLQHGHIVVCFLTVTLCSPWPPDLTPLLPLDHLTMTTMLGFCSALLSRMFFPLNLVIACLAMCTLG